MNKKGFTIVELLIVIVVIAILAAISLVAYNGVKESALKSTLTTDIASLAKQLELHRQEHGVYPVDLSMLKHSQGNTYTYKQQKAGQAFCLIGNNASASVGKYSATHEKLTPYAGECALSIPFTLVTKPVSTELGCSSDCTTTASIKFIVEPNAKVIDGIYNGPIKVEIRCLGPLKCGNAITYKMDVRGSLLGGLGPEAVVMTANTTPDSYPGIVTLNGLEVSANYPTGYKIVQSSSVSLNPALGKVKVIVENELVLE